MSHSFSKIWIHIIFSTKERKPLINGSFEKQLYNRIESKLKKEYNSYLYSINGTEDHIHLLLLLNQNHSVVEIIKNLKGETSHWINQNIFLKEKFAWQLGYGVFSVSESKMKSVVDYIKNQKEHHKKISFSEEFDLFLKKYNLQNRETVKTVQE